MGIYRAVVLIVLTGCVDNETVNLKKEVERLAKEAEHKQYCYEFQITLMKQAASREKAARWVDSLTKNRPYPCHCDSL